MDAYEQLKSQARDKRDAAISRARTEYRDTLGRIDSLRSDLGEDVLAAKPQRTKPIIELIVELIPRNKGFTFADVHRALCDSEPGRQFNQLSVRTLLPKLEAQGIIRRVSKNQKGRVVWAAAGAKVQESPYGAMPLVDVAEHLLRESGPMTTVELVVAMQEHGHRADVNPRQLVAALRTSLRRYPGRFVRGGDGRWGVAGER
jgi:hypothetical protein